MKILTVVVLYSKGHHHGTVNTPVQTQFVVISNLQPCVESDTQFNCILFPFTKSITLCIFILFLLFFGISGSLNRLRQFLKYKQLNLMSPLFFLFWMFLAWLNNQSSQPLPLKTGIEDRNCQLYCTFIFSSLDCVSGLSDCSLFLLYFFSNDFICLHVCLTLSLLCRSEKICSLLWKLTTCFALFRLSWWCSGLTPMVQFVVA